MLIIERGVGHMGMGRAVAVYVDDAQVAVLKHHQRVVVERDPGLHTMQVSLDGAASEVVTVRLAPDHDTRVIVTVFPRLSLRNVLRRLADAHRFDVVPASDRV